jgi:hypothetical protein
MRETKSTKLIEKEIGCEIKFLGILQNVDLDTFFEENLPTEYGSQIHPDYFIKEIYIKNDNTYSETGASKDGEEYYLNPEIVDEMFLWYQYKNIRSYGGNNHSWDINQIKLKLVGINDDEIIKKKLKKELIKNQKDLKNNSLTEFYMYDCPEIDVDSDLFIPFLKDVIFTSADFVEKYLVNKAESLEEALCDDEYDDGNEEPYLYWWNALVRTKRTIDFINSELDKFNNVTAKKNHKLTLNQSLILLDELLTIKDEEWENYHKTKKAEIISLLINKDYENIRAGLTLLEKKPSQQTQQFKKDIDKIKLLLNRVLG